MSAKKTTERKRTPEEYYKELVPVMLIKDHNRYKEDVTVTVNGINYQIQRGVSVMVPRSVALVLARSHQQELEAQEYLESLKR